MQYSQFKHKANDIATKQQVQCFEKQYEPVALNELMKVKITGSYLKTQNTWKQDAFSRWHKLDLEKLTEEDKRELLEKYNDFDKVQMLYDNVRKKYKFRKYEQKTKTREENKKALRATIENIKDIINCNVNEHNKSKCLFITNTYKENMTDFKRLLVDFKNFIKRLNYFLKVNYKGRSFEYINFAEPQDRGAWHTHTVFIFKQKTYIKNQIMTKLWRNGATDTQRLHAVENVGNYLAGYLGRVLTEEGKEELKTQLHLPAGKKKIKKSSKADRLHMYPTGIRIYRCSKGIKRPVITVMKATEAKRFINSKKFKPIKTYATKIKFLTEIWDTNTGELLNQKSRSKDINYTTFCNKQFKKEKTLKKYKFCEWNETRDNELIAEEETKEKLLRQEKEKRQNKLLEIEARILKQKLELAKANNQIKMFLKI